MFYYIRKERPFSERRAKFYAAEVLLAIEEFHRLGITGLTMKPESIMLGKSGHIKLSFFDMNDVFPEM